MLVFRPGDFFFFNFLKYSEQVRHLWRFIHRKTSRFVVHNSNNLPVPISQVSSDPTRLDWSVCNGLIATALNAISSFFPTASFKMDIARSFDSVVYVVIIQITSLKSIWSFLLLAQQLNRCSSYLAKLSGRKARLPKILVHLLNCSMLDEVTMVTP